jgi:hypothetical protein
MRCATPAPRSDQSRQKSLNGLAPGRPCHHLGMILLVGTKVRFRELYKPWAATGVIVDGAPRAEFWGRIIGSVRASAISSRPGSRGGSWSGSAKAHFAIALRPAGVMCIQKTLIRRRPAIVLRASASARPSSGRGRRNRQERCAAGPSRRNSPLATGRWSRHNAAEWPRSALRRRWRAPVLQFLHSGYCGSDSLRKKGNKRPGLSRSKAVHLDRLLDEALRETFPASDPIAITIEKSSKGVELGGLRSPDEPESPSMPTDSQDAVVIWAPPVVGIFSANLWALRQISYFLDWWSVLLGDRR